MGPERGIAAVVLTFERSAHHLQAGGTGLSPDAAAGSADFDRGRSRRPGRHPFDRTFSTITADARGGDPGREVADRRCRRWPRLPLRQTAAARPRRSPPTAAMSVSVSMSSIRWSATARRCRPPRSGIACRRRIAMANDLLGHRWFVVGEVVGGERGGASRLSDRQYQPLLTAACATASMR